MWRASSNTLFRPLTCISSSSLTYPSSSSRIVPHPPDLLKWVRKEGGFVHHSLKLSQTPSYGIGLVASDDIPLGSDLITLPAHIPLKFDDASSPLVDLAHHIPGMFSGVELPIYYCISCNLNVMRIFKCINGIVFKLGSCSYALGLQCFNEFTNRCNLGFACFRIALF